MGKPLVQLIEERLYKGGIDLPVFHSVVLELQQLLTTKDYLASEVVSIIQKDQALAADVLKLANSSFYTGLKTIKTIQDAFVRLGAQSVFNLVTVTTQKQAYRSRRKELAGFMKPLWRHALATGIGSRWLASRLGLEKYAEEVFLAGLLHDIGKLFLVKVIEDLEESEVPEGSLSDTLVKELLAEMHCTHGERLMQYLNMPEDYCLVVRKHHDPIVSEDSVALHMVRLANWTCHRLGIGMRSEPGIMLSTLPEAIKLMAIDLLLAELQVHIEEQMNLLRESTD
jgi:HD-like signal output (HDOD) protein